MGDDDEDPSPSVSDVVFDDGGGFRWGRVRDALRGTDTDATDLVPWLLVGLLAVVVGGPLIGFSDHGTVAGAIDTLGEFLLVYLALAVVVAVERVEDYFTGDEAVATEELRSRYAQGDMNLEEFQRRLDLVFEEGPETVWSDDPDADDPTDADRDGADRDPEAILRERYARGEIDDAEFRRRMRVLGEPVEKGEPERVTEREP